MHLMEDKLDIDRKQSGILNKMISSMGYQHKSSPYCNLLNMFSIARLCTDLLLRYLILFLVWNKSRDFPAGSLHKYKTGSWAKNSTVEPKEEEEHQKDDDSENKHGLHLCSDTSLLSQLCLL